MKFLLIYPPGDEEALETDKTSSLFAPPLGLLYLARIIEQQGHQVEVIDAREGKLTQKELAVISKSVDAIGISIPTFALKNSQKIINTIKTEDNSIPIFAGGPHCSLFPKETLDVVNINAVIQGEAESAMQYFPKALETGKLSIVPGIYYKESKKIKQGKPPKAIDDLDTIPFPAHYLVKQYEYGHHSGFKLFEGKFTSMITSRGCPYRCSFCSRDLFIGRKYRQRSADNVLQEIEYIVDQGYNGIIFVDDNFLLNKDRTMKIMDGIIDRNLDLNMIVEGARVDSADEKLYNKMWKAGVKLISFGIESGNQDVLNFYNKNITLDQIKKAVKLANNTGFFVSASFIIGAPFETKKHIENTIKFACSLPIDSPEFYILEYRVGSDLWKDVVEKKIIKRNDFFVKGCKENSLGIFSLGELKYWRKKAYMKFYLRPSYLMREGVKLIKSNNLNLLKAVKPIITKM